MKRLFKFLVILCLSSASVLNAAEDCIPKAPSPPRLVNDYAQLIGANTESALERTLVVFNDTTSTQIAIVTVNDLCDYDPASFTYEIGKVGELAMQNSIMELL